MRTLIKVNVPVEAGNKAIQDGTMQRLIGEMQDRLRPEASYFFSDHGIRTALYVADLKDPSEIPVIAEPFFIHFNASVEFTPVMNIDDLKKAFSQIAK